MEGDLGNPQVFSTEFSGSSQLQNLKLRYKNCQWTKGNQISQDKISRTNKKTDQSAQIVTSHDSSKLPAGGEQYCSKKAFLQGKPSLQAMWLIMIAKPRSRITTNTRHDHHHWSHGAAAIMNIARSARTPVNLRPLDPPEIKFLA